MIALRLGAFVSLTFALASACDSHGLRIVAGTNDSLVVNNRLSVPLPVDGVDARGRRHANVGLRYQQVSGDSSEGGQIGGQFRALSGATLCCLEPHSERLRDHTPLTQICCSKT